MHPWQTEDLALVPLDAPLNFIRGSHLVRLLGWSEGMEELLWGLIQSPTCFSGWLLRDDRTQIKLCCCSSRVVRWLTHFWYARIPGIPVIILGGMSLSPRSWTETHGLKTPPLQTLLESKIMVESLPQMIDKPVTAIWDVYKTRREQQKMWTWRVYCSGLDISWPLEFYSTGQSQSQAFKHSE